MNSLRILFVVFNMPWQGGGTFYRAFGFAKHLVRRGHQVTLLATSLDRKWHWNFRLEEGVKIALAPSILTGKLRSGWDPYELFRRIMWLRKQNFDLVHGFESRPIVIFPVLYAHKKNRLPLVLDWGDWFGRGGSVEERSPLMRIILRPLETFFEEHYRTRAQASTVINQPLRERAISLGVNPHSIFLLPNGAETEKFQPTDRYNARKRLNLPDESKLVGYLGQAFPRDAALMARAFRLVRESDPLVKLVLIGNHKTDINSYISRQKDDARASPGTEVIETGFVSDQELNNYLAACDLLWLPLCNTQANIGRWPMKINDYMSCGRATVATNVGDLVQLFQGERPVGLLAKPDSADFAQKTLALLTDEASRKIFENNARHKVETQYAWELVTEQLEEIYQGLTRITPSLP